MMTPLYVAASLWVVTAIALSVVWRRQRSSSMSLVATTGSVSRTVVVAPPVDDPIGRVVELLRRRPWIRRSLSALSVGLLIVAVVMLGYPVYTNFYADRRQAQLEQQLASPELAQLYRAGKIGEGDALTRIKIPRTHVDVIVVEGVSASALRAGAGHYPDTALPCTVGNVGIAGHRTTYGRPFNKNDQLRKGDTIILETPIGECTYEVVRDPFAVYPDQYDVVADTDRAMLTLTTCHPPGSAAQRLVVRAKLVRGEASGA